MADSPFLPQATPTQQPQQAPELQGTPEGLAERWKGWMDKPSNRSALMQFGIAMLQPVQPGESQASHFANSIGYGGMAAKNVGEQERADTEAESKGNLRTAQGLVAEARAQAAQSGIGTQAARLENAALRIQNQQESARSLNSVRAANAYQNYVKQVNADNLLKPEAQRAPVMDFDTWAARTGVQTGGASPEAGLVPGVEAKPTAAQLAQRSPQNWETIRGLVKSNDPRAGKILDQLRGMVSDPSSVDALLKGK